MGASKDDYIHRTAINPIDKLKYDNKKLRKEIEELKDHNTKLLLELLELKLKSEEQ
jgi:hypothetical protein